MMWWDEGGWGLGDWLAMSTMMVLFSGLVAVLVVWLVRSSSNESPATRGDQRPSSRNADLTLAERFARGEIEEDEFTRRRAVLHNHGGSKQSGGA
jgi:putative membrane protein